MCSISCVRAPHSQGGLHYALVIKICVASSVVRAYFVHQCDKMSRKPRVISEPITPAFLFNFIKVAKSFELSLLVNLVK